MAVEIDDDCNQVVAGLFGVHAAVVAKAREGEAKAKATLDRHKGKSNKNSSKRHSYIEVTVGDKDALLSLVDPDGGAIYIEFGARGWHGTHAITGAF